MKAKPVNMDEDSVENETNIRIFIPENIAPINKLLIPVQIKGTREGTKYWTWNGDMDNPTIKPSIKMEYDWGEEQKHVILHCFINDGKIQILNDSINVNHIGETLDLLEIE